ncbi:MAG: 5-formyltetrahydrofolate cyclo-ligase [Rhodomicrobiaceae bacterium]
MASDHQHKDQKIILRRQATATRNAIPAEIRRRNALEVARIGPALVAEPSGTVAGYYPVRSEFDCLPLMEALSQTGYRLALPVITGAAPLKFREWHFGAPITRGLFGVCEPVHGEFVVPSVLLVPLLAFDRRGVRLGYGGGHYDRTLAALRSAGTVTAIGLAFEAQEVEQLPADPHDEWLDWILTPSGPIRPKERI